MTSRLGADLEGCGRQGHESIPGDDVDAATESGSMILKGVTRCITRAVSSELTGRDRGRDILAPEDHHDAGPQRPGTHDISRGREPYRPYAKGAFAGSTPRSGAGRGLHVRGEAAHGDANPVAVCCSGPLNWRPLSPHFEDVKARRLIRTE